MRNPGLRYQSGVRIALRVLGLICTLAGAGLLVLWFQNAASLWDWAADIGSGQADVNGLNDFNAVMNSSKFGPLGGVWMPVAGAMLLSAGAWMLRVGFLGFAARYLAGETAPVVKDTAEYVTDGEGILGVGRVRESADADSGAARFCSACGAPVSASARFCQACGERLA